MELLCEYKFDIKHIKGKENKVVDVLSRKMHVAAISTSTSNLKDNIIEVSVTDEIYQQMKEGLKQHKIPQKFDKYKFKENVILIHKHKVYVPDVGDIRKMVLKEMHDVPYVVHSSYQKTIAVVRKQYYWPWIKNDLAEYIARCIGISKS